MPEKKANIDYRNLTCQDEIDALCATCREEGRFAFDTEFVMEDRYLPEACLLQIATRQDVALIDPFQDLDLMPIWELIGLPEVEVVVHAGQEDLALAVQHTGHAPQRIFDVQIAAGFVGFDYPISLQKLVQATRHIRLHKSRTLTDWRKRPLTKAQLRYAAEDVLHLLDVHEFLSRRLDKLERREWAEEEFARFEQMSLYRRAEDDKLFRVKGTGALDGRRLAIVRDILEWRDQIARRYNRPIRIVLKDHLIVEIAKHELKSYAEIRELRGINLRDSDVRELARTVHQATEKPEDSWPTPKPRDRESPREAVLAALMTSVARSYCMENQLAYSLAATQKSIRELIRLRASNGDRQSCTPDLLNGWRGRSIGAIIDKVLAGEKAVSVKRSRDGLTVEID